MCTAFTLQEIAFYKAILEKFLGEKIIKSEIEADVQCTGHSDRHPSLAECCMVGLLDSFLRKGQARMDSGPLIPGR